MNLPPLSRPQSERDFFFAAPITFEPVCGQDSAATVQGTRWLTEERCDGTLTRVRRGRVSVKNAKTGKTVTVSAGHSYLAPR